MGTAGELPKEPVKKTVFEEDMTEEQLAEAVNFIFIFIFLNTDNICAFYMLKRKYL